MRGLKVSALAMLVAAAISSLDVVVAADSDVSAAIESSSLQINLQKFFPQYRTEPNQQILQADVTRTFSSKENEIFGAAKGAIGCLFSDDENCYQAAVGLGSNPNLKADEIMTTLNEGLSDDQARFNTFGSYIGRIDDQALKMIKAARHAHIDLSRNFDYLKDQIKTGDATSYELYKKATDFRANLDLIRANLDAYENSLGEMQLAYKQLAAKQTEVSAAQRDCRKQLSRFSYRVQHLRDITETYQHEHDLLNFASLTQETREDEGYNPNFLYALMNQATQASKKLADAVDSYMANDGVSDAAADTDTDVAATDATAVAVSVAPALSAAELQEQVQQVQEQQKQLTQMSNDDQERFEQMQQELALLKQDSEEMQKQIAYYQASMQILQNQLKTANELLAQVQSQKQQLEQQDSSAANQQKLQEYELYIAQLEQDIEQLRQSYLGYAECTNTLNIDV